MTDRQTINVAVPHTLGAAAALRRLQTIPSTPWQSMFPLKRVEAKFTLGIAIGDVVGTLTVTDSEVRIDTGENPWPVQLFDGLAESKIKAALTEALK